MSRANPNRSRNPRHNPNNHSSRSRRNNKSKGELRPESPFFGAVGNSGVGFHRDYRLYLIANIPYGCDMRAEGSVFELFHPAAARPRRS